MAAKNHKFIDVLNSYLKEGMVDYGLSFRTQKDYHYCSGHLRRFFRGYYVSYDAEGIPEGKHLNGHAVERYRRHRMEKVHPVTVQKEIIVASNAIAYQVREKFRDMPNPFEGRHITRRHRRLVRPRQVTLPVDKEPDLLIACQQPARDMVEFMLETALRKTETLELTWDRVRDGLIWFEPQHHKSGTYAQCALSHRAQEILNHQPRCCDRVFTFRGQPVGRDWLRNRWEEARKAAGLEWLWMHDLRRTAASRWRAAGKPLDAIQIQLRHTTLATTESVYAKGGAELAKSLFA